SVRWQAAAATKAPRPYTYNFDRPIQYGYGHSARVGINDPGVEGVWHRIELEMFLTTPSTVPENARRANPVIEPDHTGDGFVKLYLTKDIDGERGEPGERQLIA